MIANYAKAADQKDAGLKVIGQQGAVELYAQIVTGFQEEAAGCGKYWNKERNVNVDSVRGSLYSSSSKRGQLVLDGIMAGETRAELEAQFRRFV